MLPAGGLERPSLLADCLPIWRRGSEPELPLLSETPPDPYFPPAINASFQSYSQLPILTSPAGFRGLLEQKILHSLRTRNRTRIETPKKNPSVFRETASVHSSLSCENFATAIEFGQEVSIGFVVWRIWHNFEYLFPASHLQKETVKTKRFFRLND